MDELERSGRRLRSSIRQVGTVRSLAFLKDTLLMPNGILNIVLAALALL